MAVAKIPLSSLGTVTTVTDEYPLLAEGTSVAMDTCPLVAVIIAIATEVTSLPNDVPSLPLGTVNDDDDDGESSKSSHSSSSSHSNSIRSARRSLSEQFNMVTMEAANHPTSPPISPLSISEAPPLPSQHIQTAVSSSSPVQSTKEQPVTVLANQKQTPISTNQDNFLNPTNHIQVPNSNKVAVTTGQFQASISTNQNEAVANQTELPHHFCVAIDVRSLRLLVDHMRNVQLTGRYSYPFFGTSQSVIIPAIKPLPYMECSFDQSYCAFDFATSQGVLMTQLNSVPLVIELLENNSSVVAMATIMMSVLLAQPVQSLTGGVHRQYYDSKVAVVARSLSSVCSEAI